MELEFVDLIVKVPRSVYDQLAGAATQINEIEPSWKLSPKAIAAQIVVQAVEDEDFVSDLLITIERAEKERQRQAAVDRKSKIEALKKKPIPAAT
jgi:hypothetical protein